MSLKNLRVDTANIEADLPFLAKFLNVCIKAGIPRLNTWLKQNTFKIPNRIAGIFNITDLTMAYHENYLDIGVTPVFHPIFEEIDERFLPFIPIDDEPFYLAENKGGFTTLFLEQLGEKGEYLQSRKPDFDWTEFFWDQMKLFLKEAKGWIKFLGF